MKTFAAFVLGLVLGTVLAYCWFNWIRNWRYVMRQADVVVGGVYETKIGDNLVRVKVLYELTRLRGMVKRTVYRVARADNGKVLPKTRTAAALRTARADV